MSNSVLVFFFLSQPVPAGQQPGYWAMSSGSNPASTVTVSSTGATAAPNQAQALQVH